MRIDIPYYIRNVKGCLGPDLRSERPLFMRTGAG